MKMEAEKQLQMAKDAFEAGNYSEAMDYAKMAVEYGKKAEGLRLYFLLSIPRGMTGSSRHLC
jgi:HEPN domain-containing protein